MSTSRQRTSISRAFFSTSDLLWFLIFLLLILILVPSLSRARQHAKLAVCSANLRGLGQGLHIYANDNREWFPTHYFEATHSEQEPSHQGVSWVGTMGTNDFLSVTEDTSPTRSPTRSHPSRSLFKMVIAGMAAPSMFVCPSSADDEDDMRNYGPDASDGVEKYARPGKTRFDFRGYSFLSYGYQLPYGYRGRPRETLDARMVIMADKSPYYARGEDGVAGTRTVRDARSDLNAPSEWKTLDVRQLVAKKQEWRPYNSRNHRGEGQNVLFVDGHVVFDRSPILGVHHDNIYTLQMDYTADSVIVGTVPGPDETLGPLTQTDSFLVP
jgi:prepilin-type processing-associated H-X9-DG protein